MYGSYREPTYVQARRTGLGLVLRRDEGGLTYVKEIVPGYGAHRQGGVSANDQLLAVDSKQVEGWELEDIKNLTTGEVGSYCVLTLRRDNHDFQVTLERTLAEMGISENLRGMELSSTGLRSMY